MNRRISVLVDNIGQLLTLAGPNGRPRRGADLNDLGIVVDGAVAISGDSIVAAGRADKVRAAVAVDQHTQVVDAAGKVVVPGFVDPHTHPVFGGTREDEYAQRIAGATYEEILARGGGILDTVRHTRAASEETLYHGARRHFDTMLRHGTTTVEAKSGYGLTTESELKQLRVIDRLAREHPLEVVATFLGAHVVPPEFRENPDNYVDLIVEEMLPAVAAAKLAEYCDVWCEASVFTVAQSRRILNAACGYELHLRLHANQLSEEAGTRLAVELCADSVDHLERLPADDVPLLAAGDTIATLLPGVAFTLGGPYPDARGLIEAGVAVALGTDFNPGSCFTESVPMIIALACNELRMTPAEAIIAATLNAAWALNRADRIGSLECGKQADLVILDAPDYRHLPYHFGVNLVETVIKAGVVVVENGRTVLQQ